LENFFFKFPSPLKKMVAVSPTGSGHPVVVFFLDLVNARDNPRPERRRRKNKIEKENPPTNTQTHREPLDGWMD
jgi:hypothetical protein